MRLKAILIDCSLSRIVGIAKYFLDLEIAKSPQELLVFQTKYIKDIVHDTEMQNTCTTTTPLPPGIKFVANAGVQLPNLEAYRRLVGHLLYLNSPDQTLLMWLNNSTNFYNTRVNSIGILVYTLFVTSEAV
ncbi:UNVERIFIED_CONTAM: hypothetical protein Slati_2462400 [Sesamum latifolium]|uniref:Reverse transcriptase Ty1/copia-type domain-containing protein n=1 Tax=Sesamum latifolium TaxID=2727402 RepID=A0AAW2WDG2_9LAMI